MPIIKDKYGAKGESLRSKFVTRKKNKAVYTDTINDSLLNTEQRKALQVESIRTSESKEHALSVLDTSQRPAIVTGVKLSTADKVEKILTLSKGESLKEIIIAHYHGSGTSAVVSIYWSTSNIQDLRFTTVTTGRIFSVDGGVIFNLLSDKFTDNSQLSFAENFSISSFSNVSKDIYFYGVTSVRGPEITLVKC